MAHCSIGITIKLFFVDFTLFVIDFKLFVINCLRLLNAGGSKKSSLEILFDCIDSDFSNGDWKGKIGVAGKQKNFSNANG